MNMPAKKLKEQRKTLMKNGKKTKKKNKYMGNRKQGAY
tara:strand:- start:3775 stop:3888 length:114 start_codon:yes stop_codon:yes gene_type:complete